MLSWIIQCEKYDFKGWLCHLDPNIYMSSLSEAIMFNSKSEAEEIAKNLGKGDPDNKITIIENL